MRWNPPHHAWWLAACVSALLFATLAGGFSLRGSFVFTVIFFAGAALLNTDEPAGCDSAEAEDTGEETTGPV